MVMPRGGFRTTKGLVITISAALVSLGITLWLMLPMTNAIRLGNNPLFPFLLVFLLTPLYPLYRLAKMFPRLTSGIITLVACLLVTLAAGLSHYVFHIDNPWVGYLFDLSQVLSVVSGLLLFWQGVRGRRSPAGAEDVRR
jgi:hypothetical protein